MQGFMHFSAKIYTCGKKSGLGGLIDPLRAEDVKRTEGVKI